MNRFLDFQPLETSDFDFDNPVERRSTDSVKWDKCLDCEELPLWVADMDFRTAPAIVEALKRRAEHGIFGYSCPGDDYYEATIDWFARRHQWEIKREEIIYTTGVVPAISASIKALTQPGDSVVIMAPVYTCFYSSIRNNDCRIVESPLKMVEGAYEIDYDDLEEKLSSDEANVLLLCNPHNPGGRVWTREELLEVDRLCVKHGVVVVSDEIHGEMAMPGYRYTPFGKVASEPCVSLTSPSKSFNTAGLHVANIICRSEEIRAKIDRAININEICDIGPFGIEALIAAYRHGEPWLNAMIEYVYKNFLFLCDELSDVAGIKVMKNEGSYLAWIDITGLGLSCEEVAQRLRSEARLWIQAGTTYGEKGEGYIRINMATSRKTLAEALRRFKTWIVNRNTNKSK